MVEKMHCDESNNSERADPCLVWDLNLPSPAEPLREHWPMKISWSEAVGYFAPMRERYMREGDSPEARLRAKNPARFVLT